MKRRTFLGAGLSMGGLLTAATAANAAAGEEPSVPATGAGVQRPRFIWDNREDEIYHEVITINDTFTANDPRYYAFYNKSWTFNRAMKWLRAAGTIVAYQSTGDLQLSGTAAQSVWLTGPENLLQDSGATTRFTKRAAGRNIDCAVLPMFQYHLGQHPVIELAVTDADADWQFCIGLKGRAGPPLICSGWQSGARTLRFDVAQMLRHLGYEKNFAEVHFIIGTWNEDPQRQATLAFTLTGRAQPAVVACLPVIRNAKDAKAGVNVTAILTDAAGKLVHTFVQPVASLGSASRPMVHKDGVWQASLSGLTVGNHAVTIEAPGFAPATQYVRITDGRFFTYDKRTHYAHKPAQRIEPLSGSYQGVFFAKDTGLRSEQFIMGQAAWDGWDREGGSAERAHGWESLTPAELDEYFAYLAKCGWDLLHLHQYWGIWERLDAFGNLAPHGAEQLALYLRTADRHGLASIQALSSYSYSTRADNYEWWGTVPWKQTLEAGFRNEEWYHPQAGAFQTAFHQYLTDFVAIFGDETALFALSASGEGDHTNGLPRSNDVRDFVRTMDRNHIFYAEAILGPDMLYDKEVEGWTQDYLGARTYGYGRDFESELDLGIFFKFLKMVDNLVMSEGAWPASNLYTQFLSGRGKQSSKSPQASSIPHDSWIGTIYYRTHIRDTLYIGMTERMPIMLTWDEKVTEDERRVFHEVRKLVNWDQRFQQPGVAMLAYDSNMQNGKRGIYGDYERAFRKLGLNYRIVSERMRPFPADLIIYDSLAAYEQPAFKADGGRIPDTLRASIPVKAGSGYYASWCWSEDRQTLLAYFYNVTEHVKKDFFISPINHRVPREIPFEFSLTFAAAGNLRWRFYDLNDKTVLRQGTTDGFTGINLPATRHDFLLVIAPGISS